MVSYLYCLDEDENNIVSVINKNPLVTKITGYRKYGYVYEGTFTSIIEESHSEKSWFWEEEKIDMTEFCIGFKFCDCGIDGRRRRLFGSDITYKGDSKIIHKIRSNSSVDRYIKTMCRNIKKKLKSEDECCLFPDIEECTTYPLHDILYAHVLDKYEVLCYDFIGEIVFEKYKDQGLKQYTQRCIKFLYEGTELEYLFPTRDKISKKVCLNCGTIDNSEEEERLKEFDNWVSSEMKKINRKKKAKRLCGESEYE